MWRLLSFAVVLLATGCGDSIEKANEAAEATRTPVISPLPSFSPVISPIAQDGRTSEGERIDIFDVRDGDCLRGYFAKEEILNITVVSCNEDWEVRVINSFTVDRDASSPPPESYFDEQALARCDRRYTNAIIPTSDSWRQGDRVINCLQESYGLSLVDRGILDRAISPEMMIAGECIRYRDGFAEIVPCSGPWDEAALNVFEIEGFAVYPEQLIDQLAEEHCDPS